MTNPTGRRPTVSRRAFVVALAAALPLLHLSCAMAAYAGDSIPGLPGPIRPDPPPAPPATPPDAALASLVAKALGGQAGTFGVAVRNLKTGQSFTLDSDSFYPSASLYKLAVMYEVFRQNAAGGLAFDGMLTVQDQDIDETDDDEPMYLHQQVTIQKALELMIDLSSNAAAHILADRVGWVQINQSMANVALNHTRLPVGDWKAQMTDWRSDTACTSPGDMLAFFDHLYHRQLVSPAASDQMLKLLLGQRINDRIPADLPPGTAVAHKTGNLEGIVNDAGIVFSPSADFVLVILSHDADDGNATTAEAALARLIYDLFQGKPSTP